MEQTYRKHLVSLRAWQHGSGKHERRVPTDIQNIRTLLGQRAWPVLQETP